MRKHSGCCANLLNLVLYNLPHQMKTIQLFNRESVPCYWSIAEKVKPFKKVQQLLFYGNFNELFQLILKFDIHITKVLVHSIYPL